MHERDRGYRRDRCYRGDRRDRGLRVLVIVYWERAVIVRREGAFVLLPPCVPFIQFILQLSHVCQLLVDGVLLSFDDSAKILYFVGLRLNGFVLGFASPVDSRRG